MYYDDYLNDDIENVYYGPKTNAKRKEILARLGVSYSEKRIVKNGNTIIVFLDYFQNNLKYDLWKNGSVLHLHGTGKYKEKNDIASLNSIDKALYYLYKCEITIHLFWAEEPDKYRYGQKLICSDIPYQIQEEENGEIKYIWIFPLVPDTQFIIARYKMDKKYWLLNLNNNRKINIKPKKREELIQNDFEDECLMSELRSIDLSVNREFKYLMKPREKQLAKTVGKYSIYRRNKEIAFNALLKANFECEIDSSHKSFISKRSNKKYMEVHHLIPLAYADEFEYSLDVEENIVSLCSNCHNQIHYGKDSNKLIEILYNDRKDFLKLVGLDITLEELLKMYETE